jgi:hypothetical protein
MPAGLWTSTYPDKMAWKLHDEWIDLPLSTHFVTFKNSDTGAEHKLSYPFGIWKCPTCGAPKQTPTIDFETQKAEVLAMLEADHKQRVAAHLGKYSSVRMVRGPK